MRPIAGPRTSDASTLAWRVALLVAVALAAVLGVPRAAGAVDATPSDILHDAARFDGQTVTVRGTVTQLRERVSRRGNAYYTFELSDGHRSVHVFAFGKIPCRDGATVTVEGVFQRVKRVGGRTFSNEVEARTIACR